MKPTATVIDFVRFRQRKQAQQRARAMWDLYARHAGLTLVLQVAVTRPSGARHA